MSVRGFTAFLALALLSATCLAATPAADDEEEDEAPEATASVEPEPAPSPEARPVPPLVAAARSPKGVLFKVQAPSSGVFALEVSTSSSGAHPFKRRYPVVAGANSILVNTIPSGPARWKADVITRDYGNAAKVGSLGRGEEQFTNPQGITLGTGGRLYVADTGSDRVEVLSDRHTFLFEFGGFSADSARVQQGETQRFDEPVDLVQSINRDVYVVDRNNARVVRIDRDGRFLSAFGTDSRLKLPRGIASNRRGEIVVADTGNDRLVVFDRDGREQRTFGTFGWGPRQFKSPYDVAVDDENSMIVADTFNDRVQIFDNFGKLVTILKGGFGQPLAVRADSDGMIWIVDGKGRQVLRYARDNRVMERFAAPRLPLEEPTDVAITPEGHLYIVDRAASCLWRVECRVTNAHAAGLLQP